MPVNEGDNGSGVVGRSPGSIPTPEGKSRDGSFSLWFPGALRGIPFGPNPHACSLTLLVSFHSVRDGSISEPMEPLLGS